MERITISKSCKKCERSSTYVKKKLRGQFYFVCSGCGFKLCPADKIMNYAFPSESKPYSSKARQHGYTAPRRESRKNDKPSNND